MKGDQWEIIEFPAVLPSGKALWPEYWKLKELEGVHHGVKTLLGNTVEAEVDRNYIHHREPRNRLRWQFSTDTGVISFNAGEDLQLSREWDRICFIGLFRARDEYECSTA